MKINKSTGLYFLISCIIFILYSVTVLILVSNKNEVFLVSFVFSLVALMVSTGAIALSNSKIETLFIPIVIISVLYFSVQIIVGIIVFLSVSSLKVAFLIQLLILSIYVIIMILIIFSNQQIENYQDSNLKNKSVMKSIISDVEFIYINEQEKNKKALLNKLYDNFRYSDPVSLTGNVYDLDAELQYMIKGLSEKINDMSFEDLEKEYDRITSMLNKRNLACKNSK